MDIITAFKYLECGYRIRRNIWDQNVWISSNTFISSALVLKVEDVLAEDWSIILDGIIKDFPPTYKD